MREEYITKVPIWKNQSASIALRVRVCILAALVSIAACTNATWSNGKWESVRADSLSDGVPILALYFIDMDRGWALTPGELLKLSDRGNKWTTTLSNADGNRVFYALALVDAMTGFIVGAQKRNDGFAPLILQTTDAGSSWQERAINVPPVKDIHVPHGLHGISFCNANVGWAVGDGLIVRTADGGRTWDIKRSGNHDERLFGVACASSARAWVVGSNGLLLKTTDAGDTWTHQELNPRSALVRIRFFDQEGWILGGTAKENTVFRTLDGGATWQPQFIKTSDSLFDIYMNGAQGWIVGTNGAIFHTKDDGRTWERWNTPTTNDLTCLFFLSPHQGWAGGVKRTLLRFTD